MIDAGNSKATRSFTGLSAIGVYRGRLLIGISRRNAIVNQVAHAIAIDVIEVGSIVIRVMAFHDRLRYPVQVSACPGGAIHVGGKINVIDCAQPDQPAQVAQD